MKIYFILFLSLVCLLVLAGWDPDENVDAKPMIYLYPQTTTEVSVKLEYQGNLIPLLFCSYYYGY